MSRRDGDGSVVRTLLRAIMATPLVGVRMGARHEDGRYTDMIWFSEVSRPKSRGGFIEPNKTVVK